MMNQKLKWPCGPDKKPLRLGTMDEAQRAQAVAFSKQRMTDLNDPVGNQIEAFIEEQTFIAEERLAGGGDMNDEGTDFA